MRGSTPILLLLLLVLVGCDPSGTLHLVLAPVEPDPLEDAVALRVTYFDGAGDVSVDLPLDDTGAEAGVHGEEISDLLLEALDADGEVLSRGRRSGDLTPGDDGAIEATVVLLRVGEWSVVQGLESSAGRHSPCALPLGGSRVLVTGGGDGSVDWLDLDQGTVHTAEPGLTAAASGCQGALLADGTAVLAETGDAAGVLQRIDTATGALLDTTDTGRAGGVLASVLDGQAAWWVGGDGDLDDLTSDLVLAGEDGVTSGPDVEQAARSGHAAVCTRDGSACAVFGCDDGPCGWWTIGGASVLSGQGGTVTPTFHDQTPLHGAGRSSAPLDGPHVAGLVEDETTTLRIFDLTGDGSLDWEHRVADEISAAALATTDSAAWIIGGRDETSPRDDTHVAILGDSTDSWQIQAGPALQLARHSAAAVGLEDGRIVVIGGTEESGAATATVEIFQP